MSHCLYFTRSMNKIKKIDLFEIYSVNVEKGLVTFNLKESKIISTETLNSVSNKLPDFFIKINRNVLVNGFKINEVDFKKRMMLLDNMEKYSVSIRRISTLKSQLNGLINHSQSNFIP